MLSTQVNPEYKKGLKKRQENKTTNIQTKSRDLNLSPLKLISQWIRPQQKERKVTLD